MLVRGDGARRGRHVDGDAAAAHSGYSGRCCAMVELALLLAGLLSSEWRVVRL